MGSRHNSDVEGGEGVRINEALSISKLSVATVSSMRYSKRRAPPAPGPILAPSQVLGLALRRPRYDRAGRRAALAGLAKST